MFAFNTSSAQVLWVMSFVLYAKETEITFFSSKWNFLNYYAKNLKNVWNWAMLYK